MKKTAQRLQSKGRFGDTELVHLSPTEVGIMDAITGGLTTNPDTGLKEGFFFLPALFGGLGALGAATPALAAGALAPTAAGIGAGAAGAGLGAGALGAGLGGAGLGALGTGAAALPAAASGVAPALAGTAGSAAAGTTGLAASLAPEVAGAALTPELAGVASLAPEAAAIAPEAAALAPEVASVAPEIAAVAPEAAAIAPELAAAAPELGAAAPEFGAIAGPESIAAPAAPEIAPAAGLETIATAAPQSTEVAAAQSALATPQGVPSAPPPAPPAQPPAGLNPDAGFANEGWLADRMIASPDYAARPSNLYNADLLGNRLGNFPGIEDFTSQFRSIEFPEPIDLPRLDPANIPDVQGGGGINDFGGGSGLDQLGGKADMLPIEQAGPHRVFSTPEAPPEMMLSPDDAMLEPFGPDVSSKPIQSRIPQTGITQQEKIIGDRILPEVNLGVDSPVQPLEAPYANAQSPISSVTEPLGSKIGLPPELPQAPGTKMFPNNKIPIDPMDQSLFTQSPSFSGTHPDFGNYTIMRPQEAGVQGPWPGQSVDPDVGSVVGGDITPGEIPIDAGPQDPTAITGQDFGSVDPSALDGGPTDITPGSNSQVPTGDAAEKEGMFGKSLAFMKDNPLLTIGGLAMLSQMMQDDGGGGEDDEDDDYRPASPDYEVNTPPADYIPGVDPEFVFYRQNGITFAEGGPVGALVPDQQSIMGDVPNVSDATVNALMEKALMAISGQSETPDMDLAMLRAVIGEEAFAEFMEMFAGGEEEQLAGGIMGTGGVAGNGGGVNDDVPAMIDGMQPASLSSGEYVIPADVVSHMGDGNTNAGIAALDDMTSKVRQARTGNGGMPPSLGVV